MIGFLFEALSLQPIQDEVGEVYRLIGFVMGVAIITVLRMMIKGIIDEWAGERIGKLNLSKRRVYLGGTIFDENII